MLGSSDPFSVEIIKGPRYRFGDSILCFGGCGMWHPALEVRVIIGCAPLACGSFRRTRTFPVLL